MPSFGMYGTNIKFGTKSAQLIYVINKKLKWKIRPGSTSKWQNHALTIIKYLPLNVQNEIFKFLRNFAV